MTAAAVWSDSVFWNENLLFATCLVCDVCLFVCLFDCGCLILFTVRVDAHYKILARLTSHKAIQKHLWFIYFFSYSLNEKKQKQEPIKTTCFLKGEAGLLFFCLFDAVVIYHHALTPPIVARHMLHYLLPFFSPPPVKAKLLIWCSVKEKRNHPQISFFWGNQLLNYKSRWCLTLTQSRGRSCEEIHQRLISEKKEEKKARNIHKCLSASCFDPATESSTENIRISSLSTNTLGWINIWVEASFEPRLNVKVPIKSSSVHPAFQRETTFKA